jgi:hypothetical protein
MLLFPLNLRARIMYRYKLSGLDDNWKETKLTTLAYRLYRRVIIHFNYMR